MTPLFPKSKNRHSIFLALLFSLLSIAVSKAQTADLIIQKSGPVKVHTNDDFFYTIKISNNGPLAVINSSFRDTFPEFMSNISLVSCSASGGAVCPDSSQYSIYMDSLNPFSNIYILQGTIPFIPLNGEIELVIKLTAPQFAYETSFSNTAYVFPPDSVTDPDLSTNSSTWNTVIVQGNSDIAVSSTVDDLNGYDCNSLPKAYNYTVRWINHGPGKVSHVLLDNQLFAKNVIANGNSGFDYFWFIDNLDVQSSANTGVSTINTFTTGSVNLTFTSDRILINDIYLYAINFGIGDTITLTYTITFDYPTISKCTGDIAWNLENEATFLFDFNSLVRDTFPANDTARLISSPMSCANVTGERSMDIKVFKTVDDTRGYPADSLPKTFNYTVTWVNDDTTDIDNFYMSDELISINEIVADVGTTVYNYPWAISNLSWESGKGNAVNVPFFIPSGHFQINHDPPDNPQFNFLAFLSATAPKFERGDTITLKFAFTLSKPDISGCGHTGLSWDLRNTATFQVPDCVTDTVLANNIVVVNSGKMTATNNPCMKTDIEVVKFVDDNTPSNCEDTSKSYHYTVLWINHGPADAESILIRDFTNTNILGTTGTGSVTYHYTWNISDINWSASPGSVVPAQTFSVTNSSFNLPDYSFAQLNGVITKLEAGDTVALTYTFTLSRPEISGCGLSMLWALENFAFGNLSDPAIIDTNTLNNAKAVSIGTFNASSTDLVVSGSVSPSIVNSGDTMTINMEFYNASSSITSPATWIDTLPETFEIDLSSITCSPISNAPDCGTITYDSSTRILKQEIADMAANSGLRVTFKGMVHTPFTLTEFNKAYAIHPCLDCVPATNFTQTNYQINGACDTVFAGLDADTLVDYFSDTLYLFNLLHGNPNHGGSWTMITGFGAFDSTLGTYLPEPGAFNRFMYVVHGNSPCPNDTAYVDVHVNAPDLSIILIDTVPVGIDTSICFLLQNNVIVYSSCDTLFEETTPYGEWHIDSTSGCLIYTTTHKGTDSLCLQICDTTLHRYPCNQMMVFLSVVGIQPVAVNDTVETGMNTSVTISVLANDLSEDYDPLLLCSPAIIMQPANGTTLVNTDSTIVYSPATGYSGRDSFQYTICDPEGKDTAWVYVSVRSCDTVFAGFDTTLFTVTDTIALFDLLGGHPNHGGTWSHISGTPGGTFDSITGIFIEPWFTSENTFRYIVEGTAPCPSDTSYITIYKDVIIENFYWMDTLPVNSSITVCVPFVPGTNTITFCDSSISSGSSLGSWKFDSTGCVVYSAGQIKAADTICVLVCDPGIFCTEATIILAITGVPPIAINDSVTTGVNIPVTIPILSNDIATDNDTLTPCPSIIPPTGHATIIQNPGNTITYIPVNGFTGTDSFQYVLCDPDGNDTAWVYVTIRGVCDIPNAFSPNGDGMNDLFIIPCAGGNIEFDVWNRWGIEVYRNVNYLNDWDGKYQGSPLPDGTYFYTVKFGDAQGRLINQSGFVTLHR